MIENLYNRERYGIDSTARTCDCGNQTWHGDEVNLCKHLRAVKAWMRDNN